MPALPVYREGGGARIPTFIIVLSANNTPWCQHGAAWMPSSSRRIQNARKHLFVVVRDVSVIRKKAETDAPLPAAGQPNARSRNWDLRGVPA